MYQHRDQSISGSSSLCVYPAANHSVVIGVPVLNSHDTTIHIHINAET